MHMHQCFGGDTKILFNIIMKMAGQFLSRPLICMYIPFMNIITKVYTCAKQVAFHIRLGVELI